MKMLPLFALVGAVVLVVYITSRQRPQSNPFTYSVTARPVVPATIPAGREAGKPAPVETATSKSCGCLL